ncbi:MAG TPA: hypothetical protein VIO61_09380 [Anaerolineaceae bacterium]
MTFFSFDGVGWLLLSLVPLLYLQRWLHREIQLVFLYLTNSPQVSLIIFSLLFFPGVFLHELSHFLMAKLLGVKTGRVSLFPKPTRDGKLQLGFVETARTDFLRDAMIGTAPLITGGLLVYILGSTRLGMTQLVTFLSRGDLQSFWQGMLHLPSLPDFWLWFYLAFVISSMMLPSAADRRAWMPVTLVILGVLVIAMLAGAGEWMLKNVGPGFNQALRTISIIFIISQAMHLVLLLPVYLIRVLLGGLLNK